VSLRDGLRVYLNRQSKCVDQLEEPDPVDPSKVRGKVTARYGAISCLDDTIEAHDGRIRPVFE
jgi:hypothetical protein